jgi:hypothetical protein
MINSGLTGASLRTCCLCGKSHSANSACECWTRPTREPNSLEDFFQGVRSSCTEHAKRKGYTNEGADAGNVAGPFLDTLGVTQAHAIGEIGLKLLEFQRAPRRVVALKIAGWAWRLWCSCGE